jgi:mannosidase alpha-like ER degradation enhancer 1
MTSGNVRYINILAAGIIANLWSFTTVGHYNVRPGHLVYINDSSLFLQTVPGNEGDRNRVPDIQLRFYVDVADPIFQPQTGTQDVFQTSNDKHALVTGYTAYFGGDLSPASDLKVRPLRFIRKEGVPVHREKSNSHGCEPYKHQYPDSVLVVHRGDCTFLQKLLHARSASAAGVLVIGDDDAVINPTANADELVTAGDLHDVAIVLLPHKEGQVLVEMIDRVERLGSNKLSMVLDYDSRPTVPDPERRNDPDRILYLNEHPLLNTRLLV